MTRAVAAFAAVMMLNATAQAADQCDKRFKRSTVVKLDGRDYVALLLPCAALIGQWAEGYHVAIEELAIADQEIAKRDESILILDRKLVATEQKFQAQSRISNEEARGREAAEKEVRKGKLMYGLSLLAVGLAAGIGAGVVIKK